MIREIYMTRCEHFGLGMKGKELMPVGSGSVNDEDAVEQKIKDDQGTFTRALEELNVIASQTKIRRELLEKIESIEPPSRVLSFVCSSRAGIDSSDIPVLGDFLEKIEDVQTLNLLIDGPGGDGLAAEKIVNVCRSHCTNFRVLIPCMAKSAATIIALGADELVMGQYSEIGPIDPQIRIIVDNVQHQISAVSFVLARDLLLKQYDEHVKKGKNAGAILQQIAFLNPAFIHHCEQLIGFSRDVTRNFLDKYMFSGVEECERKAKIEKAVGTLLTSIESFRLHGRAIGAQDASTILTVKVLSKDDPLWKHIWAYYVRVCLFFSNQKQALKIIETKDDMLVAQGA